MADFVAKVNDVIINPILALVFVAALFYFLWGVFIFIIKASEESAREEGRRHIFWGLIGMVVMVSVYAILEFGLNTFDVNQGDLPADLPLELD